MDTTRTTVIYRICSIFFFYFIANHDQNLAGAVTLEFCQSTYHTTNNKTETGVIKSPGFGTEVRYPNDVPNFCTIYITVCSGCRVFLSFKSMNDCVATDSCFLRRASVTLDGFLPMKTILFNSSSSSILNVTSVDRSVAFVFQKSPVDPVTEEFGFYIYYNVRKPERIRFSFNSTKKSGTFSSPGFPNRYSTNADTFMFQFEAAPFRNYLTLSFSDWYLSKYSKVTIQRGLGETLTYDRLSDRPTVISTGEQIFITFDTGTGDTSGNYIGFKATYNYTYGTPGYSQTVQVAGIDIFDSIFGGEIAFGYPGPGVVDHVWVIPWSDLIGSNGTKLKLIIHSTTNLPNGALEIRSGPTSEGELINWIVGHSHYNEAGFYLRLRSVVDARSTISFNAVFAWTRVPNTSGGGGPCGAMDFVCQGPLECLKSKDLYCDGIRHCDGGTDELECTATSKPCPSYWMCRGTDQNPICITRRCDGLRDCLDSSDELNCPVSTMNPLATTTWHQSESDLYSSYSTLSIALPLAMLGIIIVIIVSFILCIAIRRKRHLSVFRRTLHNEAPPGDALGAGRNDVHYGAHFTPNSGVTSPPAYGEIVLYNNQGFVTSPTQIAPPPYEEIAKPLAPTEAQAPPPPYLLSDETDSVQPPQESRASPRRSGEQRTSPRRSGEQRTSPRHSGEQRTSPRHSGEQRTSGSTDALISGNTEI